MTPSRLKQKKRAEGREPAVVVMAPFSAKAIVQFEDVPITKTARRQVRVLNPSDDDIEVSGLHTAWQLLFDQCFTGQGNEGHPGGAQLKPGVDGAHGACKR